MVNGIALEWRRCICVFVVDIDERASPPFRKRTVTNSPSDIYQLPWTSRRVDARAWKWNTGEYLIEIGRSDLPVVGCPQDDFK